MLQERFFCFLFSTLENIFFYIFSYGGHYVPQLCEQILDNDNNRMKGFFNQIGILILMNMHFKLFYGLMLYYHKLLMLIVEINVIGKNF